MKAIVLVMCALCSYRLAPNVTFPVPFEDCLKATQYFFSHTDEFGVDKRRLAVAGRLQHKPSMMSLAFIDLAQYVTIKVSLFVTGISRFCAAK